MEELLILPLVFIGVGLLVIIFWRLFVIASGLFLIGLVSGLVFVEVYGAYLLFTEPNLYMEDLTHNGLISFTGFYTVFNLALLVCAVLKIISWKRG